MEVHNEIGQHIIQVAELCAVYKGSKCNANACLIQKTSSALSVRHFGKGQIVGG